MREVADMICGGVMLGALFGLLAIAVGVVLSECVTSWRIWRSKRAMSAMSILALVAIIVGGNKPPAVMVRWDEYFTAKSAIVDTNDLRRIDFAWSVADGVPPIAAATLHAIEVNTENPEPSEDRLFMVATVPMTNRFMAVQMPTDATNYLYWMECSFIPDAPIVTNGVYHLACAGEPGDLVTNIYTVGDATVTNIHPNTVWVPMGTTIYDNSRRISPPETNGGNQ